MSGDKPPGYYDDLGARFAAYGASPEFADRVAKYGAGAPPSPSGGTLRVPRLNLQKGGTAAPTQGYATTLPRAKTYGVGPARVPRPAAAEAPAPAEAAVEAGGEEAGAQWRGSPTFLTETHEGFEDDGEALLEFAARGASTARARSPLAPLWFEQNPPAHASARGAVQRDIHKMLLGSREVRARLAPRAVCRQATLEYLSTPRGAHGDPTSTYAMYGPLEWSAWKNAELEAAREQEERSAAASERWQRRQVEALATYREHKDRQEEEARAHRRMERRSERKYRADLHRFLKGKASDDLADFQAKRAAQVRRAEELRRERCGGFALGGDLTVR